ncbi:MAG TPA: hypothetical protein VNW15_13630 [Rhizomicrobium sp.]|nr:hypothetical protein [Rhizomicrobium sp.]
MDEAQLRQQERALMRGIGICLLAFAAGMGLWAYNYLYHPRPNHLPAPPPPHAAVQAPSPPKLAVQSAPPAIPDASVPGPRYVHRGGSVLRDKPKSSGHTLKKEMKGAKVILEALQGGGWARVTDGNIKGWMRASVLGVAPPAP